MYYELGNIFKASNLDNYIYFRELMEKAARGL